MVQASEELKKMVLAIHPLNEQEWTAFSESWQSFSCKRKKVLTVADKTERYHDFRRTGHLIL